jgi:hypothetical protein
MNILTLSPIIIIVLAIIFFLLTKKILKAIGFMILLFLLFSFIGSILVYQDVQDFKENFNNEEKLFLLKNKNYVAGIVSSDPESNVVLLDNKDINQIRQMSKRQILGDNYKILIFSEPAFNEVNSITFNNKPLSEEEAFEIINSNNTLKDAAEIITGDSSAEEEEVLEQLSQQGIKDESELRAILFTSLINSATNENKMFLINEIKSKAIEVYPKTAMFVAIKFVPDSVFSAINKGQQLKEKVNI